jgi:hypothetical protein
MRRCPTRSQRARSRFSSLRVIAGGQGDNHFSVATMNFPHGLTDFHGI